MQRGQRSERIELLQHVGIRSYRCREVRATVYDPVAHRGQPAAAEQRHDTFDQGPGEIGIRAGAALFDNFSSRVLDDDLGILAAAIEHAPADRRQRGLCRSTSIGRELDAGRAGIESQDRLTHGHGAS